MHLQHLINFRKFQEREDRNHQRTRVEEKEKIPSRDFYLIFNDEEDIPKRRQLSWGNFVKEEKFKAAGKRRHEFAKKGITKDTREFLEKVKRKRNRIR